MADTSQYLQYYKPGQENSTIYTTADILKSAATPGSTNGVTYEQFLKNSGYVPQGQQPQQTQQSQSIPQPSLTVSSSDLANRPLVSSQQSSYRPPALPTYNQPATPAYTPPAQVALPELPKLQQINLGPAPTVQSQDQLLQQIQSQIKPLSDQEKQNITQSVDAGFASQLAEQQRVNGLRNLFEKAAAAQRGDLGFGTSELAYTGLANVQQSGADALARLQAAKIAEQNTRLQAANETNRANQIDLLNQANQLRQQQQQEAQTYINNQMAANDAALQEYKIQIDNTRYANDQARQQALDQFDSLKYENELQRQNYQDQLQAYTMQQSQAKDTLAMISELDPNQISNLGDLSSLESSIGLPPGYIQALQQTKQSSLDAKNNAQMSDVYNQGVQLALSLPQGQSFSLQNPDGSTTTFTGTKPNEFQVINNSQGVWSVNKDTGEITQLQSFSSGSSGSKSSSSSTRSSGSSGYVPAGVAASMPAKSILGAGLAGGAGVGVGTSQGKTLPSIPAKPSVDISKFDPQIQLIINGQTTFDKLSAKDRSRLSGQLNQASQLGLLPGQNESGILNEKQQTALDKTPEVKKLSTLSDFKSKLSRYNNLVDTYGIQLSGSNKAKLDQAYADLKISYKNAAELGALAGPDLEILIDAIKPATGLSGLKQKVTGGGITGIKNSITQMINNVNEDAQKNINLLNSRNPVYKNSEYVKELISPFKSNSSSDVDSIKNQYGISY